MVNNQEWEEEVRMNTFIDSMCSPLPPFLLKLENEAKAQGVPIIRPQTQSLIWFILTSKRPKRILEVGAAVGFSSLLMRILGDEETEIVTMELDEERIRKAKEHYKEYEKEYGKSANITLLEGDATEILPTLQGSFDFIFMDAAKGQYIHFLPECKRLLAEGGLLLSDNILQEGDILSSKYAITRRNRTIHKRMREYLQAITQDEELQTLVLPTGDGATITVKKVQTQ